MSPVWRDTWIEAAVVLLFVALVVGLDGCSSVPPTTEVPVAVSCVDKHPERPPLRSESDILQLDDYRAVLAYRAELKKRDMYIGALEDVVTACEGAPRVVSVPR
jgi:hypothetical protein